MRLLPSTLMKIRGVVKVEMCNTTSPSHSQSGAETIKSLQILGRHQVDEDYNTPSPNHGQS